MSLQFANNQPRRAGGTTGRLFTENLLKTGKHTITAVCHAGSSSIYPKGAKVVTVYYDDNQSLVTALKGQDFLIITLAITAPEETHEKLVKAAAEAGVPYVMPNAHIINFWGSQSLRVYVPIGDLILSRIQQVKDAGLECLTLVIGFWYEHSLALGDNGFGIDIGRRTAILFYQGEKAINTSSWPQCGRALAVLASLKKLPENADDKSFTLAQFRDRLAFVSSFRISQRDMLKSVQKVIAEGGRNLQQGLTVGFYKLMYGRAFYASGGADYEPDNELLGLPEDDLDEATAAGVELAKTGYSH